jgi:hypothetical protein
MRSKASDRRRGDTEQGSNFGPIHTVIHGKEDGLRASQLIKSDSF